MSMTVEGQTSEREEIQKAGGVSDILLNSSALLLQPGQCGPAVCVCVCLVWVYLLPWTRCLLWDKLLSNRVFAWSPGCWFFSYWSKWVSATGCLCAAVQEHTVAYTCVFVSASHTPVRDCSHACYCNRTWGLRAPCVRAAAEWSAQRGDESSAGSRQRRPRLQNQHYTYWAEYWSTPSKLCGSQMATSALPSWQNETWTHFTALDTNTKNMRYTVVFEWWVLLWGCWSVLHNITFGSNAKIITIFSLVQ